MKKILLFDNRFPDRKPHRLTVADEVASACVRAGVAAAADPAEAGALAAGGALDPGMLTEVVLQHGTGQLARVFLPYSVVLVAAGLGLAASIGTPLTGVVTPTPTPTPTPAPGPVTAFDGMWADKIASVGWYSQATGRNALYDGTSDKTYMALEEVDASSSTLRSSHLYAVDNTGTRTGPFKLFDSTLTDDDHGVPELKLGPNRRMYSSGGVHSAAGVPMIFAMSGVDNFTSFTAITGPTPATDASAYAYSHMVFRTSTAGNVIRRKETTAGNNMVLVDTPFTVNPDGTLSWGTEVVIVNFGGGRVYASDPILLPNGKLRLAYTYADYPDTLRQDIFVGDYDPAAGTVTSPFNGTVLNCPVSLTGSRNNLRITRQQENNLYGGLAAHVLDAAGNYHVAYLESAAANSTAAASMPIMYRMLPAGSQTLTAAVQIATTIQRYSTYELRIGKNGALELDFISLSPFFASRVGDYSRVKQAGDGSWGAATVMRAAGSYAGFDRAQTVQNGNAGPIQAIFCECSYSDNGNTGGSNNPTVGTLRAYALSGDSAATIKTATDPALTTATQRLATQPSALSLRVASQAVEAYRALGFLATRDAMWLQASRLPAEADFARLDLIGTRDLTMNSGMSFAQVSGKAGYAWLGDGVTGVQDTGFNPSTMGVNFTLNVASCSFDVLTEGQRAAAAVSRTFSSAGQNTFLVVPRTTSDTATARANDATTSSSANTSALGTFILRRKAASGTSAKRITRNGVSVGTNTTAATAVPTTNMLFGGGGSGDSNPSGTYQLALGTFGGDVPDAIYPIIGQINYRFKQEMGLTA
ncbi:hypothetical protein SAMN05192583_2115 [Sphingomonas gellani]|uniref:Uncharacterized protein n=1 Tax=Sphingomonas gellani TaxID=1166340 RepID=A0A1H8EAV3_9SPHN|nr:hypothetical protein [Sphingomonas gellani]SEN16691.1 hypothetical protein SAMN05192583_2115 [Sphingomonas gellani]